MNEKRLSVGIKSSTGRVEQVRARQVDREVKIKKKNKKKKTKKEEVGALHGEEERKKNKK